MKACIIQPPYSRDTALSDEYFDFKMKLLDKCAPTLDLIVLPEYSDVPCATSTKEETLFYHKKYIAPLLDKCIETAKRCKALVFVNALYDVGGNYRNTTYVYDRGGELVGRYFKKHLPPLEAEALALDAEYTLEFSEPYVVELEGLRYAFLTCYDFYFYEAFAAIARKNVDIIIGCSLQRSDSHDAIETMCRFLAYNTNAYVLRSSVSFGEEFDVCGASMAVSPRGRVLANMRGRVGMETVEFDPKDKYYKPAGFGNPDAAHYEYIEYGRKPWQYRPAGSAIVKNERQLGYPRVCAHRGFGAVAPENSLPAFGAAIALGVDEIEFDVCEAADGHIVAACDATLKEICGGFGTREALMKLDIGERFGSSFRGLRLATLEEILGKFSCHAVMNIRVEPKSGGEPLSEAFLEKLIALIDSYDCRKYVYFTSESDSILERLQELAPDVCRCCVGTEAESFARAMKYGCKKIQLPKSHFDREAAERAHALGLKCNVALADEPREARELLDMGADTILTSECNLILQCVKR